jgi:hypothetical protein
MMNWKGCGRKRLWPNLRNNPGIILKGLMKTTKNLDHYCVCCCLVWVCVALRWCICITSRPKISVEFGSSKLILNCKGQGGIMCGT